MPKLSVNSSDGYDPNRLLNALIRTLGLRTDARLARAMGVQFILLQKVRRLELPVSSGLLIRMEEISGWRARTLRDLMGAQWLDNSATDLQLREQLRERNFLLILAINSQIPMLLYV